MTHTTGDILISGYYGRGNLGDDAILLEILHEVSSVFPGARKIVATRGPVGQLRLPGVVWVDATDFSAVADIVRASSMVLVGGGGLFHDYWPVEPFELLDVAASDMARQVSLLLLARGHRIPALLYGVGVGPLRSEASRSMTSLAFQLATRATVRDTASLAWLETAGLETEILKTIRVTADPTFALGVEQSRGRPMDLGRADKKTLVVVPRFWDFGVDPAATASEMAGAVDELAALGDWSVVLFPFQTSAESGYEDDLAVCRSILRQVSKTNRVRIAEHTSSWRDATEILSQAELVLAMRYHAVVIAARVGRPVVGLAYDPKIDSLMTDLGLQGLCLPPEAWQADVMAEKLRSASKNDAPSEVRDHVTRLAKGAGANLQMLKEINLASPSQVPSITNVLSHQVVRLAARLADDRTQNQLKLDQMRSELRHAERLLEDEKGARQAQAGRISSLQGQLEKSEQARSQSAAESRQLHDALRQSEDNLVSSQAEYERALERLKREVAAERIQSEVVRAELAKLRSTRGVRLLNLYWRWLGSFAPAGSRRRGLYLRIKSWFLGGTSKRYSQRTVSSPDGQGVLSEGPGEFAVGTGSVGQEANLSEAFAMFRSQVLSKSGWRVVCIFSPTPMLLHEGQRSTHLALELARSRCAVVHISYRWHEEGPWVQDQLDRGILKVPLDRAEEIWQTLCESFAERDRFCLIEFPHPMLFGLLAQAEGSGWLTAYDIVDDWEGFHAVGQAPWFDREYENQLVAGSDVVTAVSEKLASKHASTRHGPIGLVPNGFDPELAPADVPHPVSKGSVTIGYFGYMTGAWFDWELIRELAAARPGWSIHLVGYGGESELAAAKLPNNVDYFGRQPRSMLAPIAANWDVGIIPFRKGSVAEAADPIKAYEYLGLGLPVVASGVVAPSGAGAWFAQADSAEGFALEVEKVAAKREADRALMIDFARENTWKSRVDVLLGHLTGTSPQVARKHSLFDLET